MKLVEFSASALAKIRSLPNTDRARIGYALHLFATEATGDIKAIKDSSGELRLRVGDWRVRFTEDLGWNHLRIAGRPTRQSLQGVSQ